MYNFYSLSNPFSANIFNALTLGCLLLTPAIAKAEMISPSAMVVAQNAQSLPITVQDLSGFQGIITALNVTPDGKYLAIATGDSRITLINLETQKQVYSQSSPVNDFANLAISNDGQWLAIAAGNNIDVRRLKDGMRVKSLAGHTNKVSGIAFSPDGKTVVSVSGGDRTIRVWGRESGKLLQTLADNIGPTTTVVFTPDGDQFITGAIGDDRTIKFWDAKSFELLATSPKQPGYINSLAITPDGNKLVGAVRNYVKIWNLPNAQELSSVKGPSLEINMITVSPNNRWIATANKEGNIMLFDTTNGKQITSFSGHKGWVLSLAFSPESDILYSGGEDKLIKIWNLSDLAR